MQKRSSSWLRHLNPFHFEAKYLVFLAIANLLMAFLLIGTCIFVAYGLPKFHHAIHTTDTLAEKVSDAKALRQAIHGDTASLDAAADAFQSSIIVFVGLSGLAVINSICLCKAHRMISNPTKEISP